MSDAQQRFLSLSGRLPARLSAEQVAWLLNCPEHDVPVLVSARLLKPLGDPQPNATKYYATAELLELMQNQGWLNRMTKTIHEHWRTQNARKKQNQPLQVAA